MKRLLKWLRRSVLAVLILVLLILGLAVFLLGTDTGFGTVVTQVSKRIDGLDLGKLEGNLTRGLVSDELSYGNEAMAVKARGLDSEWRLACLVHREFCLDRITIDELDIETFATDTPPKDQPNGPVQLPSIHLPIDLTVDDILIRQLRFQPPGDTPVQVLENIHLSARTRGSELTVDTLSLDYQTYDAEVNGNVTLEGDYPLDLTVTLNAADLIPDELPEGTGAQAATVVMRLGNTLRQLDIDTTVSGTVNASLSGTVQPLEPDLPASITLTSEHLGWPIQSQSQVQADDVSLGADGTLADYRLTLAATIDGEQLPSTELAVSGTANTERLSLPGIDIRTLGGTAKASANVSWKDLLQWDTQWTLRNINPSLQVPEISGKLNGNIQASGRVEDGNWTLKLPRANINGSLRNYPFSLDAVVSKGLDNVWLIDRVLLNNDQNRIDAKGKVGDSWDIKALINLPQLQNLMPELAGGFTADLSMSGPLTTPDIDLNATSSVVKFNDIVVQGISIKADIQELFVKQSSLNVALGTLQSGDQLVQNTRLTLAGRRAEHRLTFFADGPDATTINLAAEGSLNEQFDWNGKLESVELEVPAHDIRLDQPTALSWNNATGKFAVDAHCWTTEGSNLCLQNQVVAEADGHATITLDQYALARLNAFMPAETTLLGSLQLDAEIHWGEGQPGGFAADISTRVIDGGARVSDADDNPVTFTYDTLNLDAEVNPESVSARLDLSSKDLGQANIALQLDPAGDAKPINGTVSLDGLDIRIAKAFLPDFDDISGSISLNGEVSGQLTDPRFDGQLVLDNPILRAEMLPLPMTGGRVVTSIKGKRAVIDGELKSDEGRIVIEGSANWQDLAAWRADISLDGNKLNLQSDPLRESEVNHEIQIRARPGVIRIDGDIDIPMASIDVEDLPQGAASVSSDVVIVEDIEEDRREQAANPPSDTRLQMALAINLGDDVNLSAYGLTARLTGDMDVRMNSPKPVQLGGEIEVVDGIYKQYGQNLQADGQILFVGPVNQTRLAIDAVRVIDTEDPERTAGLHITGTVANPEITLFTEPDDKSEDAILSYIVLGRDINETNDQEANLLATAALALTVKGGRNIAGGIANALGVQDFALETRGSGDDTELVVSGRLNDRLLLRYGRSVFETTSTLYLRYDLTKKLYLEAAQGAVDQAVDIFYSFSF
ncbi:autotransporter assembly complex protein TamB [Granulosicoccus sp. 3-233]|uniref:autotransporter assembly complex protein TamB n=1 Tax=Granulosicoccus sp. 3-233 TaxID=3417969 RepID=UPI003D34A7A0